MDIARGPKDELWSVVGLCVRGKASGLEWQLASLCGSQSPSLENGRMMMLCSGLPGGDEIQVRR